jgi:3-oxoacyl-[acyl-carrier protein] reductase
MKKTLSGKWALVTGSSRGIGQQIVQGLTRPVCHVYGIKKEHTKNTLLLLSEYDVEVVPVSAELSIKEEIKALVEEIIGHTGGVDILYNNTAVMRRAGSVWHIPEEEWKRVFAINLHALIFLCNAFSPIMQKRGYGRIINLISCIKGQPDLSPYSVSKAAVDKYSRDIAFELKDDNVLVNCLDSGWLHTDLGGPGALFPVETVLPGALVPVLLEYKGPSGELFQAQKFKYLSL